MSNWKIVDIGNSGLFIADGNYSSKYPSSKEFVSEGIPFIRANNFKNKTIVDDELYFISPEKHSQITKGHLKPNDVLITTRGNIGELAIVPNRHLNSNINAQIVLLRCNKEWEPLFLLHILSSSIVKEQLPKLTTGTALKQLPVKNLKKIKIPLPPLPQQQKIANILDAADELRQNNKKLIAKYDELTQALFLDMFGDPVSNPKGWEKISGRRVFKLLGGAAFKSSDYSIDGIPLIRIGAVNKGYFDKSQLVFLPVSFNTKFEKYVVYPNDLLITLTGTVGKEDYGNAFTLEYDYEKYFLNQRVAKIALDKYYDYTFIKFYLKHKRVKNELIGVSRGVRQANISNEDFYKLEVIQPSIFLQNQFAERVALIEEQKAIAQKGLEKSETLFNSLLQKAFKGELT